MYPGDARSLVYRIKQIVSVDLRLPFRRREPRVVDAAVGNDPRGPDEVDDENSGGTIGKSGGDCRGIGCGVDWVPGGRFTG